MQNSRIPGVLRRLTRLTLFLLTNLEPLGERNPPENGPLSAIANYFSYIDPIAVVRVIPWHLEPPQGLQMPNAPSWATWIPKLWGISSCRLRDGLYGSSEGSGKGAGARRRAEEFVPRGWRLGDGIAPSTCGCGFSGCPYVWRIPLVGFSRLVTVFPRLREGHAADWQALGLSTCLTGGENGVAGWMESAVN